MLLAQWSRALASRECRLLRDEAGVHVAVDHVGAHWLGRQTTRLDVAAGQHPGMYLEEPLSNGASPADPRCPPKGGEELRSGRSRE